MKTDLKMKNCVVLLIILLSFFSQSQADPSKWDGFRGMKWGINFEDLNDANMVLVLDANEVKVYRRLNDKLSIGDANLKELTYNFYKGRFFGIKIEAAGNNNFRFLKDAIFAYYGEGKPTAKIPNTWRWSPNLENSRNVSMGFSYDEKKEITNWSMSYTPILNEIHDDKVSKKSK